MVLKKRMTLEEHQAAARTLKEVQQLLDPLLKELLKTYGTSSQIGKIAARHYASGIRNSLGDLRSRLDNTFYDEGYGREGRKSPYYDSRKREGA